MKRFNIPNINSEKYWDTHQTALDFGLRQQKYSELAGKGKKIVELGCGLSPFLSKSNYKYKWGIDYSSETIKNAQEKFPNVLYIKSDILNTTLKDDYFDAVVAGEVIEHLEKPEKLFKEMERMCKRGGIMVLSTPQLEFQDPEHLWQFYEEDFTKRGFKTEVIFSERFKGRSYIFAWKNKV